MLKIPSDSSLKIRTRTAIHQKEKKIDEGLLLKRMSTVTAKTKKLKFRNMKDINSGKREYSVSSSVNSRKSYTV